MRKFKFPKKVSGVNFEVSELVMQMRAGKMSPVELMEKVVERSIEAQKLQPKTAGYFVEQQY